MKLIINISPFNKVHGGAELVAYMLALRLSQRGNTVYLVSFYERGSKIKEQINRNCFIYRTPHINVRIIGNLMHNFFIFLITLKIKPDIIFDQGIYGYGLIAASLTRKPYVVYGRGTDIYSTINTHGIKGFFQKRFFKLILTQASLVLALSENMKKCMKQIQNREIKVLTNGVNLEQIKKSLICTSIEKFGKKQLLFVGNVRPVKGVEYLINAMPLILEKEPETRLVIVGSYNSDFIKRIPLDIRDKILLKGFVDHNRIPALMKNSDVFVLPSLSEGIPNVVLEAMAVGLPIVATRVGGVPELIQDGENGFLVEPKSSEQLAKKIILLLSNKNLHTHISQNGLLKAKEHDINKIDSKLEKHLKSIIHKYSVKQD